MKILRNSLLFFLTLCCLTSVSSLPARPAGPGVDNSGLLPPVQPDSQVSLEGFSPDWIKSIIMAQFRIETAAPEGTFDSAIPLLDHYAETGVNLLWVGPIYERPDDAYGDNGYSNLGPHTLDASAVGTGDVEEGYRVIRRFVEAAHERDIRVIFDIVSWGVNRDAPLVRAQPEYFVKRNGKMVEAYGGYVFDWKNPELRDWYFDHAERFIEATGADGFRVDLAPDTSGYHFKELRDRLYAQGNKIMLMAEMPAERRETFDLDQLGVNGWTEPPKYGDKEAMAKQKARFGSMHDSTFFFRKNIVDAIKTGTGIGRPQLQEQGEGGMFRFYSVSPLFHDGHRPFVQGNRVRFGYLLFSPFIPVWWIGEEWNNPHDKQVPGAMYYNRINWAAKDEPENRAFYEDVKRMIRVRRRNPEIFEYFPPHVRDARIAKVTSWRDGTVNPLQAYMRFSTNKAVVVVPNYEPPADSSGEYVVRVPWEAWGVERSGSLVLTDLMGGRILWQGSASSLEQFSVQLVANELGIYLLETTTDTKK